MPIAKCYGSVDVIAVRKQLFQEKLFALEIPDLADAFSAILFTIAIMYMGKHLVAIERALGNVGYQCSKDVIILRIQLSIIMVVAELKFANDGINSSISFPIWESVHQN